MNKTATMNSEGLSGGLEARSFVFENGRELFSTVGVAALLTIVAIPGMACMLLGVQGTVGVGLAVGLLVVLILLWYAATQVTRSIQWNGDCLIFRSLGGTRRYQQRDIVSARVQREHSSIPLLGLLPGLVADLFLVRHKLLVIETADGRAFEVQLHGDTALRQASEFVGEFVTTPHRSTEGVYGGGHPT